MIGEDTMKVSDIPREELKVGLKVVSAIGTLGIITKIHEFDYTQDEDRVIEIKWDNGNISDAWHFWLDKVTVMLTCEDNSCDCLECSNVMEWNGADWKTPDPKLICDNDLCCCIEHKQRLEKK